MRDRFDVFDVSDLTDQEVTVLADDVFLMIDQGDAPTWDKAERLLYKRVGGQHNLRSYVDTLMAGAR